MNYTSADYTAILPAGDYIGCFRDEARFIEYCKACHNFGKSWGCPPFGFDVEDYLSGYETALIVGTKITPADRSRNLSEAGALLIPERRRLEGRLLEMERQCGGRAFSYVGTCLYCPSGTCTRPGGLPCRHPDSVRPSLEACGFDLGKTAKELLGIELKWSADGCLPEYLTLVCGFFYNGKTSIEW